jgi:hypothetical protein
LSAIVLNVVMPSVALLKCYSESRYAECHYAECRGALLIVPPILKQVRGMFIQMNNEHWQPIHMSSKIVGLTALTFQ